MTLKNYSSVKFEEKLTLDPKNDMRNLVHFHFHFDVLLLLIAYAFSAKEVQNIISHDTEKRSKF